MTFIYFLFVAFLYLVFGEYGLAIAVALALLIR